MNGVQLSQGYRATMRREFTFYHLSPREFLTLIWSISEGWKVELTMEPPSAFEPKTPRMGIQRRKH